MRQGTVIGSGETEFTKEDAIALRTELIRERDAALGPDSMEPSLAVLLSHAIAFMAHAIDIIWHVGDDEWPMVQAAYVKLRDDLAWRGQTGKRMSYVAIPRVHAEALLKVLESPAGPAPQVAPGAAPAPSSQGQPAS